MGLYVDISIDAINTSSKLCFENGHIFFAAAASLSLACSRPLCGADGRGPTVLSAFLPLDLFHVLRIDNGTQTLICRVLLSKTSNPLIELDSGEVKGLLRTADGSLVMRRCMAPAWSFMVHESINSPHSQLEN